MSLQHAARYNINDVQERIEHESGPLWFDKRADISREKHSMLLAIMLWTSSPGYHEARHRLEKEMEERVDEILYRSIELHSHAERGLIALMFWHRNSPCYKEVMKLLPGGEFFYFCNPDSTLEDEIAFRVERLPLLIPVDFSYTTFERYRDRIPNRTVSNAVKTCKALCASQRSSGQDVTLYFDNDDDAVYARCLV